MSFSAAEKIRFLVDLSFVSLHFGKATCARLKSYYAAKITLNTAQSFSTTRISVVKKDALKPLEGLFCFAVKLFNSLYIKSAFHSKRNCSIFIHDLERVNEFLRLN